MTPKRLFTQIRRIGPLGLGVLWLCGCGASSDSDVGMTTTTFFVQDMGERLKLL